MGAGISICILTYNVQWYNRLAMDMIAEHTRLVDYEILVYDNGSTDGTIEFLQQQREQHPLTFSFWAGKGNSMRHGQALDFLVPKARYPIVCTLCSDAFPISPEWIVPALYLDKQTVLAGIDRGWGRELRHYVCPSYLFGWRDWLRDHTFMDEWPKADTGERLGKAALVGGKQMKMWKYTCPEWGGKFRANKPCDYNGWVWHTWWGGRSKSVPGLAGEEFETDYHEYVTAMLRKRFNLRY